MKPSNCVPSVKDKKIAVFWDFSAALSNSGKPVFCDPDDAYDVVNVDILVSTTTTASQAITLSVGHTAGAGALASATAFVNAQSLYGSTSQAAGVISAITQTDTKVLAAGQGLTITGGNNGSQGGEGLVIVTLRPKDRERGNISKRPGASSQASA